MRHMGNSGKIAIGAVFAALCMLVLTAVTLEEAVLFTFLGVVAVGYVASVAEVFARHRYLALVAGSVGTSLFIGFTIAFLRMWGLAFNQDSAALGTAVTTKDSDIYFYLAAASGSLTLLVLFAGAVWPAGQRLRLRSKPSSSKRRPVSPAKRPAGRPAVRPAQRPTQGTSASRVAAPRKPATAAKRPASSASSTRKPAAKSASRR